MIIPKNWKPTVWHCVSNLDSQKHHLQCKQEAIAQHYFCGVLAKKHEPRALQNALKNLFFYTFTISFLKIIYIYFNEIANFNYLVVCLHSLLRSRSSHGQVNVSPVVSSEPAVWSQVRDCWFQYGGNVAGPRHLRTVELTGTCQNKFQITEFPNDKDLIAKSSLTAVKYQ